MYAKNVIAQESHRPELLSHWSSVWPLRRQDDDARFRKRGGLPGA
jgi:hypothetical protein